MTQELRGRIKIVAMYGVLRQYEVDPQSADALVSRIDRVGVPFVEDEPGFVSSRTTDLGTGKILWLATFAGEASARTSAKEDTPQINAQLGWYVAKPPQVLVGRVHSRRAGARSKGRQVPLAGVG